MSQETPPAKDRSWIRRFTDAGRGIKIAVCGEASFYVHLVAAVLVLVAAALLGISAIQWCLLILCIATVLSAEMFNTAIEHLARAITRQENPEIRDALDIASGAVLVAAGGAAVVGMVVLGWPILARLM